MVALRGEAQPEPPVFLGVQGNVIDVGPGGAFHETPGGPGGCRLGEGGREGAPFMFTFRVLSRNKFTHSPFIHPLTHSYTYSPVHTHSPFIHTLTHSHTYSPIHTHIRPFIHPPFIGMSPGELTWFLWIWNSRVLASKLGSRSIGKLGRGIKNEQWDQWPRGHNQWSSCKIKARGDGGF